MSKTSGCCAVSNFQPRAHAARTCYNGVKWSLTDSQTKSADMNILHCGQIDSIHKIHHFSIHPSSARGHYQPRPRMFLSTHGHFWAAAIQIVSNSTYSNYHSYCFVHVRTLIQFQTLGQRPIFFVDIWSKFDLVKLLTLGWILDHP